MVDLFCASNSQIHIISVSCIDIKYKASLLPLGSFQVIVGLLQLPHIFVKLLLDAACLTQIILQHGNLFITLCVLVLQLFLRKKKEYVNVRRFQFSFKFLKHLKSICWA